MNSDVVIIITNKTNEAFCNVNQTMIDIGLSDFNEEGYIAAARSFDKGECLKNSNKNTVDNYDLLFLSDIDFYNQEFENNFKNIISSFTRERKQIYIVFHTNIGDPNLPKKQEVFIKDLIGDQFRQLKQSHGATSVYCIELQEIAKAIKSKDKKAYEIALQNLKNRFYTAETEKKLNLLHDCLTPEGAKNTDVSFLTDSQKQLVEYLKEQTDHLGDDYINALIKLRITLLGS